MRRTPDTQAPTPLFARSDVRVFAAMMEGSSSPLGQLNRVDVERYMERFRGHLYRAARALGGMPEGVLFAALHGAYDPNTRTYPLHLHGVVTGGKIAVVDGLRNLSMYRPAEPGDGRDAANVPVQLSRKPLTDIHKPISYVLKSYWPVRPTWLGEDGIRRAIKTPVMRISEPANTEVLRFLGRWTLNQFTLVMGMQATTSGLRRL